MTVNSMARSTLFGNGRAQHPLLRTMLSDLGRAGLTLLDAKPRQGYATHLALAESAQRATVGVVRAYQRWQNSRGRYGVPTALFDAVNDVLLHRGGLTNEQPNFYCVKHGSFENAVMYSIPVGYSKNADVRKLDGFELALEDKLCHTYGNDINVRVCHKPTRIEIDKPAVPTFKLSDYWQAIRTMPTDARLAVPGMAIGNDVEPCRLALTNDRFASFIVANSGYGKTQLAMSTVLTLAMLNSPSQMSMILADNKADDWMPFNALPHLALPVITEAGELLEVVEQLVTVMDERKALSLAGKRSFKQKTILLYIDELSDVFAELEPDEAKRFAKALQRLSQRGRSAGFIIIAATQRLHDLKGYAEAYSKLRLRIAGNTTSNNDAASIAGPGVQLSKLPVGAFEIHGHGTPQRVQGFMVADADKDDYPKRIQAFTDDIADRWHGVSPHYRIGGTVGDSEPTIDEFVEYLATIEGLTKYRVRKEYIDMFGEGIGWDRAEQLLTEVLSKA